MVPLIQRALPSVLALETAATIKIVREPSIGLVIPDVLVGVVNRRPSILARSHFTTIEGSVLAVLERAGLMETRAIQRALFLPDVTCFRVLEKLCRIGAIERVGEAEWKLNQSAQTGGVELIAFEAKLRLWKRALDQAVSYLTFVDRAYVVLDGNQVRISADVLSAFVDQGVGLWLQHGYAATEVVPARGSAPHFSADRVRAIEKVLRARIWRRATTNGSVAPPLESSQPSSLVGQLSVV
jgi:hypothetical protein